MPGVFSTIRARAALWARLFALSVLIGMMAKAYEIPILSALLGLASVVVGSAIVAGGATAAILAYGNTDSGSVVVEYIADKLWEAIGRHLFARQLRGECQLAVEETLKELTG